MTASEREVSAKLSLAEDLVRKLDTELGSARQRQAQAEGLVRSRDKEVERLNRQLEAAKSAEELGALSANKSSHRWVGGRN